VTWHGQAAGLATLANLRRGLRTALRDGELPAGADDGERLLLVVEELASNALRHGGHPVDISVATVPLGWLVAVSDTAPDRPPVPALDRDPGQGGMGLSLVARICGAHGWETAGHSKIVWARVPFLERLRSDRVRSATDRSLSLAARLAETADRTARALDALASQAELIGRAADAPKYRARATRARLEAERARWAIITGGRPAW